MDAGGTYGNVFGGRTPMSPVAPAASNEQYKVNVTRQKTKKWANFKPQNYDGDDWGADDDDTPAADDVPPPPPPSSLKPGSSRLPSGPAILSSRQFTPAGGPPQLHLQTSRAVSTPAGPASAGGLLERTTAESLVPPAGNVPQSAIPVSNMHSGTPPSSALPGAPLPSRNKAPIVLQSAGPVPNLPPPVLPQPATSPRPGSSAGSAGSAGKTHSEARPTSPASSRSPVSSPARPLPFIRPADIYRRMEEERQRQSIDSADRPNLDAGRADPTTHHSSKAAASAQPAPAPRPVVMDKPDEHDEQEERETGARWIGLPYLPPLIERKSEYGLEGLLASYGSEESVTLPATAPAPEPEPEPKNVPPQTTAAGTSDDPEPVSVLTSQPQALSKTGEELRPSSTSPKLPELGRLSVFGADLFPMTSDLSSVPPVPTITSSLGSATKTMDSSPSSPIPVGTPVARKSDTVAQNDSLPQLATATAAARTDASPNRQGEVVKSVGLPSHQANPTNEPSTGNLQQQDAAAEASRQIASSVQDKHRPSLPGTWVTETATTEGNIPTPAAIDVPPSQRGGPKSRETTPVAESNDKEDKSPKMAANPQQPAVNDTIELSAKKDTLPSPLQKDLAISLLPLKTPSPVLSMVKPDTTSQATMPAADAYVLASPMSQSQVAGGRATSPVSNPATSPYADIAPTAPLKAALSVQSIGPTQDAFDPPPRFSTGLPLDTASSSPVKESDMLREEIMKSLSPHNASAEFDHHTGGTASAYHAAAGEPVRESSYLGDVYDDYWAEATPDVPQIPSDPTKKQDGASDALPEVASHSPRPLSIAPREGVPTSAAPTGAGEKSLGLRRQFSWEMAGAKTPGLAASPVRASPPVGSPPETTASAPQSIPSLVVPELVAAPVSIERPDPSSGISDEVSIASTAPPKTELDAPPAPLSPVSVLSGENVGRRQSLAEQKSLIQASTNALSPSPPLDQHPAVAQEQQRAQPAAGSPATPTGPETLNLMTFRQIMEVPSVLERAKRYNETRYQFAALDTGLEEWMQHMKSHPEHAKATASLREGLIDYMAAGMPGNSPTEGQTSYSPHHANASTAAFGHVSRPSTNIPMPPPSMHGNSPFGHSSAQVGVKSKKLLLAAGKAGKGLLSKGRHKLTATGEKVFHN